MPHFKDAQSKLFWLDPEDVAEWKRDGWTEITDAEADSIRDANTPHPDYSAMRAQAYRDESDPLFFKEQRGEVPAGTWIAKVTEIKARWPLAN